MLITGNSASAMNPVRVDVSLLVVRADACVGLPIEFLRVRICAGAAMGHLSTDASGNGDLASLALAKGASRTGHSSSSATPWVGAVGRLDLRMPLSARLRLVLGLDAVVPFTRPSFELVGPSGRVLAFSSLSFLGMAVGVGPEIAFW